MRSEMVLFSWNRSDSKRIQDGDSPVPGAPRPKAGEPPREKVPSDLLPPELQRTPHREAAPEQGPDSLLPAGLERTPRREAPPERGPSSLLPGEPQRAETGREPIPERGPRSLLPDPPGRADAGRERIPERGPSSLLPAGPGRGEPAGKAAPERGPSSLLPPGSARADAVAEPIPELGPSSLLPPNRSDMGAEPPPLPSRGPQDLLPSPPPARPLRVRTIALLASAMLIPLLVWLGVSVRANVMRLPDAYSLIEKAKAENEAGNYPAAIVHLRTAVQKAPDLPEAHYLLGVTLLKAGDSAGAERELRFALEFGHPADSIEVPLARAMLLQGRHEAVVREFGRQASESGASAELLAVIGLAHLRGDRTHLAREHFSRALALDPGQAEALLGMAQLALRAKDVAQAESLIAQVLAREPGNIDALVMRAELKRSAGDEAGARAAYASILQRYPENVYALVSLASLDMADNRLDAARERLATAVRLDPRHPTAAYLYALLQFRQGKVAEARKWVQRAIEGAPTHLPSVLLAASIDYAQGRQADAQRALRWVLQRNPYHLPARRLYGASLLQTGQPRSALEMLEPMQQVAPENPALLSLLGQAYMQLGNYRKAADALQAARNYARKAGGQGEQGPALGAEAAALEQALNLVPQKQNETILSIVAHFRDGDLAQAEQLANEALAIAPNDPKLLNLRGAILIAKKDRVGAQRDLERALAIDPDYVPAAANLAQIDLLERTPSDARKRIERISARDPRNLDALLALAAFGPRIGASPAEIEEWLKQAVQVAPKSAEAHLMLGRHYLASGRLESALEEVEAAKALTPDDARVLDTLAEVQVRLGRNADALNLLASLSVLRPDSPPVLYRLAKAQIAQGQTSAAAITLRRALELRPTFTSARFALGQLDLASGRVDASMRAAWRLQDEAPDSPQGFVLEADVHRYQGRWQQAYAAYERAWNVRPSAELVLRLQEALTALGRDGEARERMQAWLGDHPADGQVRKRLADTLLLAGKLAEAKDAYLAALELTPDDASILNNLAWIGFERNEPMALDYAERAYKLKPSEPDVLDTLAQIVDRRGDRVRARELMISALTVAPDRDDIRLRLARLLAEAGERNAALKELRTVVQRGESFAGHAEAAALLSRLER